MRYRTFGTSGLRVSELFLGAMTFGESWGWGSPIEECRKVLEVYREAGGNVIDTANKYTNGESERIVGELLSGQRDQLVVATKYTLSIDGADPNASGNHRKSLRTSLEQSLRRLNTDYVDLLWVHVWDPHTPIHETMRALDDAVAAGKVLYVGVSDTPAWAISRANTMAELRGWSPFVAAQLPYSLAQRDIERELLPMAEELGLSVAAWSPLARGLLTGKFTQHTATEPTRIDPAQISERDLTIARALDAVAAELGATPSQVALAWIMARKPFIHPILGSRSVSQLTDNLAAAELRLPADAMRRLDDASAIPLGFPLEFFEATREFAYGPVVHQFDSRRPG
ncbi:MAG: aldo/keto reductase [Actinomycetota bacterium]|nr:MAG: aldo/keto reductase [Actinomycetota bacterium]